MNWLLDQAMSMIAISDSMVSYDASISYAVDLTTDSRH
jgi:hypothetical protein